MKCAACDSLTSLQEARSQWWICTICGSYICPSCRALFLETGQDICPGAIVRGSEPHSPHFTRFLGPREPVEDTKPEPPSTVTILGDVLQSRPEQPGGKVIILPDEERPESETNADHEGRDDNE
jgi:hypothetical protein